MCYCVDVIKAIGQEIVETWNRSGATVGWIGVDKVAVGVYSVADQLRKEAVEAVKDLKVSQETLKPSLYVYIL